MDTDDKLQKILGALRGGRIEDVADKLLALFREPDWWEAEFDKQFVTCGASGALQDVDQCDAVKAFIRTLLTRTQHEERQQFLRDIEQIQATFFTMAESPEETAVVRQRSAVLLDDLRQKYATSLAKPGS